MGKHAIQVQVRGADSFGSATDIDDPRTPEQRAAVVHRRLQEDAWSRLPWAAAVHLALMGMLVGSPLHPHVSSAALTLLLVASLLAVLPLVRIAALRERYALAVMVAESVTGAAAMALVAIPGNPPSLLVAAIALAITPGLRTGAAAGTHLLLLGSALVYACIVWDLGAWATLAMAVLAASSGALSLRQSRDTRQRIRQELELTELNAVCARLTADPHASLPGDQALP